MFEYTENNHFKFGYDNQWFIDRPNVNNKWSVQYGQCKRPVQNWREECKLAASKIYDQRKGLPIDILFSGGKDSEITLRSFLEIKVPVNVHFVDYDFYNMYDKRWATKICEFFNIKLNIHNLDIRKFWRSDECMQIANSSKSVSPQLISQQWLMSQVDGIPVLGSGECYTARSDIAIQKKIEKGHRNLNNVNWVLVEREKIATWYRYLISNNRPGIPGFFQYTPELMLSFLEDPICQDLHSNITKGKLSNSSSKSSICLKHWPEVKKRYKKTGFENLRDEDYVLRTILMKKYENYHYEYWSEVNELIEYLKGNTNKMPDNMAPNITDPCDSITTYYNNIKDEQF
jgi:hypothetical protein